MRLEKYTLERRAFGQSEGAHKRCANERRSQTRRSGNRQKTVRFFVESEA